jgi:hypothetical protein
VVEVECKPRELREQVVVDPVALAWEAVKFFTKVYVTCWALSEVLALVYWLAR